MKGSRLSLRSLVIAAVIVGSVLFMPGSSRAETSMGTISGESFTAGEGLCFALTNSTYLNVTMCSSEIVNATLESFPGAVSLTIRSITGAGSTRVSMSGFLPGRTYHRHEEAHFMESFVASDEGAYSYTQDLSRPRHIFVTEGVSTKFLRDDATGGDCTKMGTWDPATKTCALTNDVFDTIVVEGNGITFDGAGHTVRPGPGSFAYGIYAAFRSGLTIRNVILRGFAETITLFYSTNGLVTGNTIAGGWCFGQPPAVHLDHSSGNTIIHNTMPGNVIPCNGGLRLYYSDDNTVSENSVAADSADPPLVLQFSHRNTITKNLWLDRPFNPSGGDGHIIIQDSHGNTVSDNRVTPSVAWGALGVARSNGNVFRGNIIRSGANALQMSVSQGNTFVSNTFWGGWAAASLQSSSGHTFVENTFEYGSLTLWDSNYNLITSNTFQNAGVLLTASTGTLIMGNLFLPAPPGSGRIGVGAFLPAHGNTISGNTILGGSVAVFVSGRDNVLSGNTIVGTYRGVDIDASGQNRLNQVIGNAISVTEVAVRIAGNSVTVSENTITGGTTGVLLTYDSFSDTISRNKITGTQTAILLAFYPGWNTISENVITGNYYGLYMNYDIKYNIIRANQFTRNTYAAFIQSAYNNDFSENLVSENSYGLYLSYEARNNIVRGNLFSKNAVGAHSEGAYNNELYQNCFLENTAQRTGATGFNRWNDGQGHGNFWSDYRGRDDGSGGRVPGDGVGDTSLPHQAVDFFPLMDRACAGNTPPTIVSLTATTATEGRPTAFMATASDAQNDALTYSWDVDNDGAYEATGASNVFAYTWGDDHTGTARVRVNDGEFNSDATVYVTALNVDPLVTVTAGEAIEGQPVPVLYRLEDPGSDDLFATIDWGDGGGDSRAYLVGMGPDPDESTEINPRYVLDTLSHVYGDNLNILGMLRISDDDGGYVSVEVSITIQNGEPRITTNMIASGQEGSPVAFEAAATDPGSDDLTFAWTFGDGTAESRVYFNNGASTDPASSPGGTFPFTASDSGTHVWGDDGAYPVQLTVSDDDGGRIGLEMVALIANEAPTPTLATDATLYHEGESILARADFTERGTDDVILAWSWQAGPTRTMTFYNDGLNPDGPLSPAGIYPFAGADAMAHTYLDNGQFTVSVDACDDDGGCASALVPVTVLNADPRVALAGPAPGSIFAVGTPVTLIGSFTDAGVQDTHVAVWILGSTTIPGTIMESDGSGSVSDTIVFTAPGIYPITLAVADDDGGVGTANIIGDLTAFIVVYDPAGGFVTGGGWIDSPVGAYALNPSLAGKATFGFVAKYQTGARVPTGQTEFHFKVADLNFHSASYEWLVVSGARAQYKGSGTINGAGDYGFLLTLVDGQVTGGGGTDKFRIKIWDKATAQAIYDNQIGEDDFATATRVIGGGSIVIHKP